MTFYEKLFSERMSPSTSPLVELESSLKDFENITIDLEKDTPAQADAGKMGPPEAPIKKDAVKEPRTKKMPQPLHKEEKEKTRDENLLQEKKKREVEEVAASAATASAEDSAKRPRKEIAGQEMMKELIKAERVPTEYLDVEVSQQVWNLLGWNSRERALGEQRAAAGQKCFFCGGPHRAFMCGDMLQLACSFGKISKQPQFGGTDRRYSLWCSSCAYANGKKAYETGEDPRKTSGWFGHTRSACHAKDRCPLDSDEIMLRMSGAQLLRHLQEKGMFGESEKEKMTMSRKSEPRSVTASEVESQEPEKKRQKKERKEQEKRIKAAEKKAEEDRLRKGKEEEERIRKETEDLKTSLRDSSSEILHGYLLEKDYRVQTQKAAEAQAKYEKALDFRILKQTPNYQSRLQEAAKHNRKQIEEHNARNARMLREEKERILAAEEEKEKQRMKKRAERKAAKKILKEVEKEGKKEKKQKKAKE